MPPHPLTNFEIQKQYQNEPRFNGGYSRDNLPECSSAEIKGGTYITKLDDYSDIGTPWAALYVGRSSPNDVQNKMLSLILNFQEQNIFEKKLKHLLAIKT